MTESLAKEIDAAHASMLRAAFKIPSEERVRNQTLYDRAGLSRQVTCCVSGDSSLQAI